MLKNFIFFFKKQKMVLDCFTYLPYVYDFAKIDYAVKFIPEWWKQTPRLVEGKNKPTIKSCPGFVDFYKKGIAIPSWFELEITVFEKDNKNFYSWESSNKDVHTDNSHEVCQFDKFAGINGQNLKITSPWAFKTKENISFVWSQPTWNLRNLLCNFTLLPANIEFKYQHGTHINYLILNNETEKTFNIPALTPLAMLHGLTEKEIKIKNHLVDENTWKRFFGIENLILNRNPKEFITLYREKKQLIDKINLMEKS
jgi:hypothetical protein